MSHSYDPAWGIQTKSIHAGETPNPDHRGSAPDIVMTTTYIASPDDSFSFEHATEEMPYLYTRWGNPTVKQLETKLAYLENAEDCVAFGSGMAAISALLFSKLQAGDHLVMSDVTYAGAAELANDMISQLGIRVSKVNMTDYDQVTAAVADNAKLVYIETPANPMVRLTDIKALAEITHAAGSQLAVDSTFATPIATRPIDLGADFVIHSLTKYLGGHGDALGGAVLGTKTEMTELRSKSLVHIGGVISPFNAWLIMRGMATFPLRMRVHEENALAVGRYLEAHPAVTKVLYPGLESHPQYELAQRQMHNFSGMLTFQVQDGPKAARQLYERLNVVHYAVSLGHQRSLVFYMPTADLLESSFKMGPAQQEAYREFAGDGIFRFSIGLEDAQDIIQDLDRALEGLI